jgi:hypothetical protein
MNLFIRFSIEVLYRDEYGRAVGNGDAQAQSLASMQGAIPWLPDLS